MMLSIILLPFKIILKLVLYLISTLFVLISAVFDLASVLSQKICSIISFLVFILIIYTVFTMPVKENLFELIIYFLSCMFFYYIPILLKKAEIPLKHIIDFLNAKASFSLIKKKNKSFESNSNYYEEYDEFQYNNYEQNTYNNDWKNSNNNKEYNYQQKNMSSDNFNNNGFSPFEGVTTLEELKKRRTQLTKCFHPDVSDGDTTNAMQYINDEYDRLKKELA